jgi:type I restriction enzyme M protein
VPGFCYSATLDEVAENDHVLTPGRYVGAAEAGEDPNAEPLADRIDRLTTELYSHFDESARIQAIIRDQLAGLR